MDTTAEETMSSLRFIHESWQSIFDYAVHYSILDSDARKPNYELVYPRVVASEVCHV
jgi:hypothetical protein